MTELDHVLARESRGRHCGTVELELKPRPATIGVPLASPKEAHGRPFVHSQIADREAQTAAKNRLHSVPHRHRLTPPLGDLFAAHHRAWWATVDVSSTERLRAQHDVATLDHLHQQLADLGIALGRLSMIAPWREQMPYLIQSPALPSSPR